MRDIVVTRLDDMLEDWRKAFPDALACEDVAALKLPKNQAYLFWLHNGYDRKAWLASMMETIPRLFPDSRMIVMADIPHNADALAILNQGAVGYCHAYSSAKLLKRVKTVVNNGGIWLGQEFLRQMIVATSKQVGNSAQEVDKNLSLLTKREREVALEAAKGLSNKEIARVLDITERTVKAHLSAAFERLGARDRLQLALILNKSSQ